MSRLISVHGTFNNDDSDEGEHWWQANSAFDTEIRQLVTGGSSEFKTERLHWDGENTLSSSPPGGE